jgi:hypothetical protein
MQADREFEDLISDTAATFTCSTELAADFAWQCGHGIEELETGILFNRIADEIWRGHTGASKELAQTIADFLTERERYQAALSNLEARFEQLAEIDDHEHLEPIENYQKLVRDRLNSDLVSHADDPKEEHGRLSNSDET